MVLRIATASAVVFIAIFLFGWLFHGIFLADHYAALPGLLSAGSQLVSYAVMPIPLELLGWWILGSLVQMTVIGALLADILKEE